MATVESTSSGKDKFVPSGMGNKGQAGGSGPTGSSRTYPKGGSVSTKPDFNPMNCSKSCAEYSVGGV
jgi:hypothetical protein